MNEMRKGQSPDRASFTGKPTTPPEAPGYQLTLSNIENLRAKLNKQFNSSSQLSLSHHFQESDAIVQFLQPDESKYT